VSPYLSPNTATAPISFALSMGISSHLTGSASNIFVFTSASTFSNSSAVTALSNVKSNLKRSAVTSEPDWVTASPKAFFNAESNKCVALWFA